MRALGSTLRARHGADEELGDERCMEEVPAPLPLSIDALEPVVQGGRCKQHLNGCLRIISYAHMVCIVVFSATSSKMSSFVFDCEL